MAKVLGVGEILWDLFATGKFLGGAPMNFVFHCRQMGLDAYPVSRMGKDELGSELLLELQAKRIPTDYLQIDADRPTGTVRVEMEGTGHRFFITEDVAWDYLQANGKLRAAARDSSAICFGSLAQRNESSRSAILALVNECPGRAVFDINLRQHYFSREVIEDSLEFSDVLKLNEDEVTVLKYLLELEGTTPETLCRAMLKDYDLELVCVTRGAQGALLVGRNEVADQPGRMVDVTDTVGCGDAFTAVLVYGLLHQKPLSTIARDACRVGEFVATQPGGTPTWPPELRDSLY